MEDEINQTTDFQKVYEEVARRLAVHRSRRYSLRRIVVVSGAIASCLVGIFSGFTSFVKVEVHESISVRGTERDEDREGESDARTGKWGAYRVGETGPR